jgi:5-dehydro-2-deoxygluconokinase
VTAPRAPRDEVFAFAFDHRNQFFEHRAARRRRRSRGSGVKKLLVAAVAETDTRPARRQDRRLCDDRYGQDALNDATGRGWWIGRPVELPGSNPVQFDRGRSIGTTLVSWPAEHIVEVPRAVSPRRSRAAPPRAGGADPRAVRRRAGERHELLLEIIPPKDKTRADDTVYRSLKRLYNLGIYPEWWKLEPMSPAQWKMIDGLIAERDPYCRGVVVLGLNASIETLAAGFRDARASRACRGFAVGTHDLPGTLGCMARGLDRRRRAQAASARELRVADPAVAGGASMSALRRELHPLGGQRRGDGRKRGAQP